MLEVHRKLDERYRALRGSRSGPIFFVEHGLSEAEIADVVADVSQHCDAHPLRERVVALQLPPTARRGPRGWVPLSRIRDRLLART
jgi:hypothetical protein